MSQIQMESIDIVSELLTQYNIVRRYAPVWYQQEGDLLAGKAQNAILNLRYPGPVEAHSAP